MKPNELFGHGYNIYNIFSLQLMNHYIPIWYYIHITLIIETQHEHYKSDRNDTIIT